MKILTIDIETSPHLSFHWRRWKENIPPEFTVEESRVICWAAKWLDEDHTLFMSEWDNGFDNMIKGAYDLLDEADAVISFNGQKFDSKRLNAEFLRKGYTPPAPYKHIDLFVQALKHFNFSSNRLKHLLKEMNLTPKLEDNADMKLWMDVVYAKDAGARRRMEDYNIQDVLSTEEFYNYMLGWIKPHPNWGLFTVDDEDDTPTCKNCGSTDLIKKGLEHTNVRTYQRYKCKNCGAHHRGRKHVGKPGVENGILA